MATNTVQAIKEVLQVYSNFIGNPHDRKTEKLNGSVCMPEKKGSNCATAQNTVKSIKAVLQVYSDFFDNPHDRKTGKLNKYDSVAEINLAELNNWAEFLFVDYTKKLRKEPCVNYLKTADRDKMLGVLKDYMSAAKKVTGGCPIPLKDLLQAEIDSLSNWVFRNE